MTKHTWTLLCCIIISSSAAYARLGETLTQARSRYGWEQRIDPTNQAGISYTSIHIKDDYEIQLRFIERGPGNTTAIEIIYNRIDSGAIEQKDINYLLSANSQGSTWGEPLDMPSKGLWKSSDGARAVYDKQLKILAVATAERVKQLETPSESLKGF